MSESSILGKAIIVFGLILVLTAFLYPAEQTGWANFTNQISNFPTFNNPFDTGPSFQGTALPESETEFDFFDDITITWTGCQNTSTNRHTCIDTDDGEGSFASFEGTTTNGGFDLYFNLTNDIVMSLTGSTVRRFVWIVSCRMVSTVEIPELTLSVNSTLGGSTYTATQMICQRSDEFARTVFDYSTTTGVPNPAPFGNGKDAVFSVRAGNVVSGNWTLDVSWIRLEVSVENAAGGCQAPEGAWFPFADEVACAIGQFGQIVWKGVLFLINGLIFIGQVLAWFAGVIFAFGAVLTFFFNIPDIPDWLQNIITVGIVAIGFLFLVSILRIVRGNVSPV